MSNQSIFEKKWMEIVFENRNKSYGAYKLRQENPKTSLFAFLFGVAFLSTSVFILSSFSSSESIPITDPYKDIIIKVDPFHPPKNEPEVVTPNSPAKHDPIVETNNNLPPVVAPHVEAEPEVPTNVELPKNNGANEGNSGGNPSNTGNATTSGGNNSGSSETPIPKGPENTATVDVLPKFPGGISNFYTYIARNFETSNLNSEAILTVYVSFVVEIDGSITDITVLKSPGYGMDKEAIRVLKSLKTKWEPGIKNGKKVRTQYTLPIKVKAE